MFHTCFMHVSYMQLCLHVCVHVCTQVTCMRVKLACIFACMNHACIEVTCIEVTCMHVTFVCTFACMKHAMIHLKISKNAESYMSLTICMHDPFCLHACSASFMHVLNACIYNNYGYKLSYFHQSFFVNHMFRHFGATVSLQFPVFHT